MKKLFFIITICTLCIGSFVSLIAQEGFESAQLISLPENIMTHEAVTTALATGIEPSTAEEQVGLAVLYFRDALFTFDKKKAEKNYKYWESIYDSGGEFRHPFIKAYMGSALTLWGGSLPMLKVGKKAEYLEKGLALMDDAHSESQTYKTTDGSKDYLLTGFISFLRGTSLSNVPRFIKVSREGEDNLKDAIKDLNRVDGKKKYTNLIANVYLSFAQFYVTSKKTGAARKNLALAEKFAQDPGLIFLIEQYKVDAKL